MSDVTTELAKEASDKAMQIARLKAENSELQNDADLLRAMLSQERLEKQCYMAENAELQETLQRRTEQFEGMGEMWVERGVENFKLRELVRDMWEGYNDPRCEECHLKDTPTCADCPICAREASVIDRMRELGIEVDG